jgi:hypothetical protein
MDLELSLSSDKEIEYFTNDNNSFLQEHEKIENIVNEKKKPWKIYFGF